MFSRQEEPEGRPSSEDGEESSSDDEHTWTQEVKKQYRMISQEARIKRQEDDAAAELKPKLYALKAGEEFAGIHQLRKKKKNTR